MSRRTVNRSSISGHFVTEQFAKSHPRTTETQHLDSSASTGRQAYRDSGSGRFVTESYASKHPKTTEKEQL
jgi:hypothetical protein